MRILIASEHPHIPQIAGGAQSSTHELVIELKARGHEAAVFSGLTGTGWLGLKHRVALKVLPEKIVEDDYCSYTTYRAWHPAQSVDEVLEAFNPDVVLLQSGFPIRLAKQFRSQNVPTVFYLRNVEFEDLGGDIREFKDSLYIANSHFTSNKFKDCFGISSEVIYPLIKPELYKTETLRRNVLFVNPHKHKGLDIALETARLCPDIPFVFQMTWTLSKADKDELDAALSSLPNVRIQPRTEDMRQVYAETKIVLAPSRWEEAYGRIATEAQISGIPVVASRQGGLPEAVGTGGVLIDIEEPASAWADAINKLWSDEEYYAEMVEAALDYASRPSVQIGHQLSSLEEVLRCAVQSATR
ncbi:hypothetical protein HY29_14110 [Hyphomonas beringensis]|uniref:Glycosyltransferase subfamily 4-like N-terminal domain-containing protein n=1 Tax=Hyphomonas beringensis TaxID=1280946 RepID=A0A062U9H0_9PROT|nr:glycosyltransferase [Hyphomonas beringensis]KCZ54388.1 hypothetical protein HY29_14110 [Hyphomonas beringensis]